MNDSISNVIGIVHCDDDAGDEAICNCESDKHFKCASGQCIDLSYRCDGDVDCPDSSDEIDCPNREKFCSGMPGGSIRCGNTTSCIMDSW